MFLLSLVLFLMRFLGEYDAGKILFKPAGDGTGVKASGACRSILELAGINNVLTKSLRGNNPHNIVKATFDALKILGLKMRLLGLGEKSLPVLDLNNFFN